MIRLWLGLRFVRSIWKNILSTLHHQLLRESNIFLTISTFPFSNRSYCCLAMPMGICISPRLSPSIARAVNSSSGIHILDNFAVVPCSKKAQVVNNGCNEFCHYLRSWSSDSTRLGGHQYEETKFRQCQQQTYGGRISITWTLVSDSCALREILKLRRAAFVAA